VAQHIPIDQLAAAVHHAPPAALPPLPPRPADAEMGGLVEGRVMSPEQVRQTADLPSREVLLAQLLGLLQAPAAQLLRTLNEPAARVARLVDSIGKRAGGGAGEGNAAS